MASTKKSNKRSIKEYVIIAAGVLLILSMVLYTCVATPLSQHKSQERPLSMIDESERSFTDTKSNVVHENRQFDDGGSKEAGTVIQVEQVGDRIGAEHTSTPLKVSAPDEHSNSSFIKERKKEMPDGMYKAQYAVIVAEKEHREQINILNELDDAADCAHKTFLENKKELKNAKVLYGKYADEYKKTHEKITTLKKEITACYINPNSTTRIPEGEDTKYDTEMKEIDRLSESVHEKEKVRVCKINIAKKALTYGGELEQNMHRSRKNALEYYLHRKQVEKRLIFTIKCTLDLFETIYSRTKLLCSVRKKEALYYIENEVRAKLLNNIIELHEKLAHNVNDGIDIIIYMCIVQKDVISAAEQVYSAYKAYDAAACKYEQQQKLRGCGLSISQHQPEFWF
ncbi:hypothetical protein NERG_01059 [Nematocida ausubeli]|uniref:Uncharacterized protein n=1 Tax=Nematocida ausubeli (strain ATCC PRA-371 / ERTm2) TaxID=1913371 RepID=H8ZCR2_NEMA1|nr:hypothetical protein NERG_01059 [Nematocida ausubeli]